MQTRSIQLPNMTIHYHVEGRGADVVFVHGWSSSRRMWSRLSQGLSDYFRCWSLDLPGFGDSDKPDADWYSVPNYTATLYAFLEAMGLPKAHIIGHSMGGMITLDFAAAHPERTDRVLVVNPLVTGRANAGLLAHWDFAPRALEQGFQLSDVVWRRALNHKLADKIHGIEYLRRRADEFTQATPESLIQSGKAIVTYDLTPRLKNILAPTLILLGLFDASIPNSEGRLVERYAYDARAVVLPAGHHVIDDYYPETLQHFRNFLLGEDFP